MARKKKDNTTIITQADAPPPPLFLGEKERNLVKQVNDEVLERVIGQTIVYYPISVEHTHFHPVYGEAIKKTFLPPIKVNALVTWDGSKTTADSFGVDRTTSIVVKFHRRRLVEDQDLFVKEGDFILYGNTFYEIASLNEIKNLFGQIENKFEIDAKCIKARESIFNAK